MRHTVLGCGCGLMSMVIQEFSSFSHCPACEIVKKKNLHSFGFRWSNVQIWDQLSVWWFSDSHCSQPQFGILGSLLSWTVSSYSGLFFKIQFSPDKVSLFRFACPFLEHGTALFLVSPPPLHPVAVLTWCTCNSLHSLFFFCWRGSSLERLHLHFSNAFL